ncbi:hypothetical protein TAO_1230 [Candidatus Nitrosoglobus terrae]|uniref:Uncharacterized protein n=1 Tax=Candidatus Nitrosoglobus terrae TaxID=1630141 RepID=A0A1Q2SN92_9GAMM|nr:hypothetical protein TAO_1230 [Candidatus Nitrosoglobus terrae]
MIGIINRFGSIDISPGRLYIGSKNPRLLGIEILSTVVLIRLFWEVIESLYSIKSYEIKYSMN